MSENGISIIICCYNSALRLLETIKYLALQKIPGETHLEVIIVNNASADNTVEIANSEWIKYNRQDIEFKIVNEYKLGLSNARDRGIQTSKFNFIIFCDDDNWLDENYVKIAHQILTKNPHIAALGGQSTAVSDIEMPAWFESSKQNYAVGKQADVPGDITYRKHLWGSGLVIRKDLYTRAFLNFPSVLSGRKEKELSSGEDSEMCMRFILMGYRLYYTEELKFKHFIPKERLNINYNQQLVSGFIKAHDLLIIYSRLIDIRLFTFKQKYLPLIKSIIRIFLMNIFRLKRWNENIEKLNIYLISGFCFKNISKDIISIKEFSLRSLKI